MKFRSRITPSLVAAVASLFVLTSVLMAQTPATPPVPTPAPAPAAPELSPAEIKAKQEYNAKKFNESKESLFRLAKRLEKSDRPEDKATAQVVLKAIEEAMKQNVEGQFSKLIVGLSKGGKSIGDLGAISTDEKQLAKMLQEILNILNTDDESARIKAEIKRLEAIVAAAKAIKRDTETAQAITESNKGNTKKLEQTQKELAKRTDELAKQAGGEKKPGDKPADPKADAKAEPKAGEPAADDKKDTGAEKGEPKGGEPKEGEPKPGEGAGERKESGKEMPKDAGMPSCCGVRC